MGCTNSKEEPKKQEEFTDLQKVNEPAQSPERDTKSVGPATAVPIEDEEVIVVEAADKKKKVKIYQQGGPVTPEPMVEAPVPLFKTGMLFKIIIGSTWYFYNDTADYEMIVTFSFGPLSEVEHLDDTVRAKVAGEEWESLKLTIYPGETKRFMRGAFNGYKSRYNAQGLSAEYKDRIARESAEHVDRQVAAIKALGFNAESDPEEVLKACIEKKIDFVDLRFIPSVESLSRKEDTRQLNPTSWLRPRQYLPEELKKKVRIVGGTVDPDDIDQGQLGDCWFLCSVASLAEFENKIVDLFRHPVSLEIAKQERAVGAYRVTINKNGWWQILIVDDYLPCIGNKPCFAKNDTDPTELWVALIEKAYAKLHKSYSAITGGDALHALTDLSGYPTSRFDSEWDEAIHDAKTEGAALFGDLLRYDEAKYLINLNTPGVDNSAYMGVHGAGNTKDFEEKYKAAGLGMGHAYSVLEVREFPSDNLRLLKIRNPWGSGTEWTGAWSDSSPLWTQYPKVAMACNFKAADDGTFWMSWTDVKKYFDGGGVCFTKFDWFDYRVKGVFTKGIPDIVLEVTVTGKRTIESFVTLCQPDRRGQARDSVDAKYSAIMLTITKPDGGQNRQRVHVNSTSDADKPKSGYTFLFARDVSVKYSFEGEADAPRTYLVVPRIHESNVPQSKNFVLALMSSASVGPGFSVKFKRLEAKSPIFENYLGFQHDPAAAASVQDRDYQFNPEVGAPITRRGAEFTN